MDVIVADEIYHEPDISPPQSQPLYDYTSGIVDEGLKETLPPQTDLPPVDQVPSHGTGSHGEASTEEPPVSIDDPYEVTWTVDIAIAVPRGQEEVKRDHQGKSAEAPPEVPRDQSYYHLEYNLLPEPRKPVKVDLAVFGPIVKIYKENESKMLRPWCEGDRMWVSWSQSFSVSVTRELLEELLSHRIHFRIWEGKDKVCNKARSDRLKAAARLPLAPSDDGANMNIKTNGIASVECCPLRLLAGATSLAKCFSVPGPPGVCEALCSISLDRALMSEQLKAELNPLVITILSASSMPSTPVPHHVLREECLPVYCQYQFHKSTVHKTKPQRHSARVYFDDVFVVLAGTMGRGQLREYLTGPPLEIQVHDRDRKSIKPPKTRGLFGMKPDDGRLSIAAFDPAVTEATQVCESYAVAHLDLSELLLGRKSLKVNLPIRSGPPPQLLGRERPMWDGKMMDLPGEKPVEQGHYLNSNAQLKVKVEIAHPLAGDADSAVESDDCRLFGRIVFVFGSNNVSVLTKLSSEICKINMAAFNIGSCSLSPEESESKDLDFVTGFHVQDEKMHLVVAEGLRLKAVQSLWETVPQKLGGSSEEQMRVLYKSSLGFSERIYGSLDVNLSPVHLPRPLEDIMRDPLVYVRDVLSHSCFQALFRLSQLCQASKLLEAVRCDLFPTEDMICSVSRELGMVPGKEQRRERRPLNMHNAEYVQLNRLAKWQPRQHVKDYVQENIREVQHRSMLVQKPMAAVLVPEASVVGAVHNYSIQTFNSHRRGWELLRKEMAKVPDQRFTYSQQYQSATVEPGDFAHAPTDTSAPFNCCSTPREHPPRPDQSRVEELKKSTPAPYRCTPLPVNSSPLPVYPPTSQLQPPTGVPPYQLTPATYRCTPLPVNSSPLPVYPPTSQLQPPTGPWRENVLHANTLEPTLTRDRWPWGRHFLDFQLYVTPPPFFGSPPPGTVHLAREQEQQVAARGRDGRWPSKTLPGGSSPQDDQSHSRLVDFKCYLGAGSGRFQEILKDEPRKYSLRKPGLTLKPLPALAVLSWGGDDAREAENKALGPGPFTGKNFSAINNAIPRRHSQYNKYRFMRYCVPHSLLHKRRAMPLTESERARHALQSPDSKTPPQNTTTAPPFNNLLEVRTHREVTLYAQVGSYLHRTPLLKT
ncbi:hypothetical protein NHX12_030337 [Muraenolepis orangiensis]|uniref:DUF4550 domain-containing protein n=1 Tax=Muraenolepis orangiensis TaxID=630683 RepID=A0A9Q0EBW4_9TELE|nr:hypothetical protein NHX12_030337 [Muraenolepis orangiensis]